MEHRRSIILTYEVLMASLALVVVAILFVELTRPISEEQRQLFASIDLFIIVIFAVDYFYRLLKTKEKWQFFKANIFDLIAIMPFDKAFRLARLARLIRLARLSRAMRFTKLLRFFAFARRFANTFSGIMKTNGLIYMIIATIIIVIGGAFGILAFEPGMERFGDAIWWSLVTTTTVGYGDISPQSPGGRVLAGFLMVIGIGFLGMVTGSVATYFVDKLSNSRELDKKSVLDEQIEYVKSKLDHLETLSSEDLDAIQQIITSSWKEKRREV